MVTIQEIRNFIQSEEYLSVLNRIENVSNIEINSTDPSFTVLNHDISKLNFAELTIKNLEGLIAGDNQTIVEFILAKLKKYLNVKVDQEYPLHEEVDDDDETIKVLPFYRNFLILYLIEYFFLKNNPGKLASYLKSIKIPQAKKYEAELKEIFKNIP